MPTGKHRELRSDQSVSAIRQIGGSASHQCFNEARSVMSELLSTDAVPDDEAALPASRATLTVHHCALAYLPGINALRASKAASVQIEDYTDMLRGHRVLRLVGKSDKPATMPLTVPVLRVLEACRGQRTTGPLILRPVSGKPVDRRDAYRMVARIAKAAGIPRHISPHSLRHAAITNALDAGVPLRDAQILARHTDPRTTEHYDRARGNLDRHAVHFFTAYVAGV